MSTQQSPAGAYRAQDGQIVRGVHPMAQWQTRAPEDWEDETNLRAVWREAQTINFPPAAGRAYARVHAASGMVLIAEFGFVQTCVRLDSYPEHVQQYTKRQLSEYQQ